MQLQGSTHDRQSAPHRAFLFRSARRPPCNVRGQRADTRARRRQASTRRLTRRRLADAVVIASDGVITAIGSRSDVQIPADARVIDCTGKTVVAGFWNSHVHFTQAVWKNAASAPAASLEEHMQDDADRWGFTTVWDLGSDPQDFIAAAPRASTPARSPGPDILLAGSMFPKGGHPVYLPREVQLPEVATPDEAAQLARNYPRNGPRRHQAVHRRVHGRQAGREYGPGHRQGRGRCRACPGQAGVRPSAKYGRRGNGDRGRRRCDGPHRSRSNAVATRQSNSRGSSRRALH